MRRFTVTHSHRGTYLSRTYEAFEYYLDDGVLVLRDRTGLVTHLFGRGEWQHVEVV